MQFRPLPVLFAWLLVLAAASPRAGAMAPGEAPFFTPVPVQPGEFRGYLARVLPERRDPPARDPRTGELAGRLYRREGTGDAAERKEALRQWEAITGPAGTSASGRPTLSATGEPDGSAAFRNVSAALLQATGEARFADALEASLYAAGGPALERARESTLLRFRQADTEGVALALFETATGRLKLDGQEVTVHVRSRFPREGSVQVQFRVAAPARFAVWIRVPAWAPELRIRSLAANTEWIGLPGDWARVPVRTWNSADWLELRFPLQARRRPGAKELPWSWGPLRLPSDPAHDPALAKRLDPGTEVAQALDHYPFPPPVARPSRPARAADPLPPGKTTSPADERRGWYYWQSWNRYTWEATVGSEPPGQTWHVRVLPWAATIRHLVYGASPDDLLPGERVNLFLSPGEDGEWSRLHYFQDELTQMRGHQHWWWVRSVAPGGKRFTARLFTAGDNLLQLPEETFEVDTACESWREGKVVPGYPLRAGERVRMLSVLRGGSRRAVLLTDDASLEAIRLRKEARERQRLAAEGLAGFVDRVDAGDGSLTADLTLFSTYWPYGHQLKPGQAVRLVETGPGYHPTETGLPARIVSATVEGPYGSGDTRVTVSGELAQLRGWPAGKVIRLIPR